VLFNRKLATDIFLFLAKEKKPWKLRLQNVVIPKIRPEEHCRAIPNIALSYSSEKIT